MATFIIRRIIQGFFVLMLATFVIFSILIITPGGPRDQLSELQQGLGGGKTVAKSYVDQLMRNYKLDVPYPWNYFLWLFDPRETTKISGYEVQQKGIDINIFGQHIAGSGVLTGEFGNSLNVSRGKPVMELMGDRLPYTLALTTSALILSLLVAFPVGIISAIRQYSRLDYTVTAISFLGLSMPAFWFGLMLVLVLSILAKQLHDHGWTWLPYLPTGYLFDTDRDNDFINRIYHMVLPVTVLSFVSIAGFSRYIRSSMLEVLRQDYVRTAWAKGLTQRGVILRHALRNALIPVITIVTLSLPGLVAGAIATETVFAYGGMGLLFLKAVTTLDIPLVMAFLLLSTTLIIAANILADVLYAFADPRIRFS